MTPRIISDDRNQDEDNRHDHTDDKQQLRLPSSSTKPIDHTQYRLNGTAADRNVGYYYITHSIVTIGCVTQPKIQGLTTRIGRFSGQAPASISDLVSSSLFVAINRSLC
jgi:hypothetical protein